jgi:hypothetical protein
MKPNLQRRRSTIVRRPSIAGFGPLSGASFALDESTLSPSSSSPRAANVTLKSLGNGSVVIPQKNPNAIKTCLLFKDPVDCLELTSGSLDPIDGVPQVHSSKVCVHVVDDDIGSGKVVKVTSRQQLLKFDVDACGDNLEGWTESSPAGQLRELSEHFCSGFNVGILHAGQRPDEDSVMSPFLFPRTNAATSFGLDASRTVISAFLEMSLKAVSIARSPPPATLSFSASPSSSSPPPLSFEMMASVFAFAEGKVRDLTLQQDAEFQRVPVYVHFVTGPRFVGLSHKPIRTMEDWKSLVISAQGKLAASKRTPIVGVSIMLKKVCPAGSGGDATYNEEDLASPDVVLSSLIAVDFHERLSVASKAIEGTITSELADLLKDVVGGNCKAMMFGSLATHDDPSSAQNLLTVLQKAATISSSGVKRGSVKAAVVELQEQIIVLRDRLATLPGLDVASRKRMEKDMVAKEHQLQELNETIHRAAENASLAHQLARANQLQRLNESETKQALALLDTEKKRRFAQAFRMAFQRREVVSVSTAEVTLVQHRLAAAEAELDRVTRERDGLKEERENLRRFCEQQTNEVKTEKHQRTMVELQLSKLKRLNAEHETSIVELETEVRQVRRAALKPSQKVVLELATCKSDNAKVVEDLLDERRKRMDAEGDVSELRLRVLELESDLDSLAHARSSAAQLECRRLEELLAHRLQDISELQTRLTDSDAHVTELQRKYLEEVHQSGVLREDLHHKVRELRNKYSIEREAYVELLHEGQCYVDEVRHLVDMQIDSGPSAYRGNRDSVVAWLSALGGLESMASTLFRSGFDTMHAVSMLTEADLVAMQCTAGTRRKILHSVKELASAYEGVLKDSIALFRLPVKNVHVDDTLNCAGDLTGGSLTSKLWDNQEINDHLDRPVSLATLVDDLEAWISDFKTSIDAEHEMTRTFRSSLM